MQLPCKMHIAYVPVSTFILKYCIKVYYLRYDISICICILVDVIYIVIIHEYSCK